MKLYRVLAGLLILLLLFAQQAAYAHAVSHLGKEAPAKDQLAHLKLCDKCVSFEKISGVAPADFPAFVAPDGGPVSSYLDWNKRREKSVKQHDRRVLMEVRT